MKSKNCPVCGSHLPDLDIIQCPDCRQKLESADSEHEPLSNDIRYEIFKPALEANKPMKPPEIEFTIPPPSTQTQYRKLPLIIYIEAALISVPILNVFGIIVGASETFKFLSKVWGNGIWGKCTILLGLLIGLWTGFNLALGTWFESANAIGRFEKNLEFLKNICTKKFKYKTGAEKMYEIFVFLFGLSILLMYWLSK